MRWLALLCIPFILGIAPIPIAETPALEKLAEELMRAQDIKGTIKILDVGTELGAFMDRIKKLLESRGLEAEVFGVDDYRNFGSQARLIWAFVTKKLPDNTILFADVSQLWPKFDKFFDYVFVNSPYMSNYPDVIKSAMKLVKDDGYCIVRFHAGDEYVHDSKITGTIAMMAQFNGWTVNKQVIELPQGDCILSKNTYLITRNHDTMVKRIQFNQIFGGARLAREVEMMA